MEHKEQSNGNPNFFYYIKFGSTIHENNTKGLCKSHGIYHENDLTGAGGIWSSYPFFESSVLIVSGMVQKVIPLNKEMYQKQF